MPEGGGGGRSPWIDEGWEPIDVSWVGRERDGAGAAGFLALPVSLVCPLRCLPERGVSSGRAAGTSTRGDDRDDGSGSIRGDDSEGSGIPVERPSQR